MPEILSLSHTHTNTHTYIHTCIHTDTHTHTHTYIYIYIYFVFVLPVFGVPATVGVCRSGCVRPAVDAEFRGEYRNTADQVILV